MNKPISPEQFEMVCSTLETTTKGLLTICKEMQFNQQAFYNYLKIAGEPARKRYAGAKEDQCDNLAESLEDIADECNDKLQHLEDPRLANAIVQLYKVRIDNIKWVLSKLKAKKYGERIEQTFKTEQPIQVVFSIPPIDTSKINASNQATENTTGSGGDMAK